MLLVVLLFAWVYAKFHYVIPLNLVVPYLVCSRERLAPLWAILLGVVVDGINPFRLWISPVSYLLILFLDRFLERVRGMVLLKAVLITVAYGIYEWGMVLTGVDDPHTLIYIRILFTGVLSFIALRVCRQE